jgi:predicted DNA-binding transcriptional regulator AlpA
MSIAAPARTLSAPAKLIGYKRLSEVYGIDFSRRHLARMEAEERFPIRLTLGDNTIRWVVAEIEEWIASKLVEREKEPEPCPSDDG